MESGMFSTEEILKRKQPFINSLYHEDFEKIRDKVEDKEDLFAA